MSKRAPGADYFMAVDGWIDTFFIDRAQSYSVQWSDIPYLPVSVRITQQLITDHFFEDGKKVGSRVKGSIGVIPIFIIEGFERLRWICFDLDSAEEVDRAQPLLNKLGELGISYLEELGGDSLERRHIWIRVDGRQTFAKEFFTRLIVGVYDLRTRNEAFDEKHFPEVFGVNKPNSLIRVPLGWHLKRKNRFPVIIPETGEITDDPVLFMEAWMGLGVLTEERMLSLSETLPPMPEEERGEYKSDNFIFTYRNKGMPLPMSVLPKLLYPVISNCQAANSILQDVIEDKMIELPGEVHHHAGLFLAGLAAYNDLSYWHKDKTDISTGKEWFTNLVDKYRLRSNKSHEWEGSWKKAKQDEFRTFYGCKKIEEKFNRCHGCEFKGHIKTPQQFIGGVVLTRQVVKRVKLTSQPEIRATTFKAFKRHLTDLISEEQRGDVLLASPQGSGKSYALRELSCELSQIGKKVLIAIPATKLALEYKYELEECGTDSFVLSSHKSGFEHRLVDFECPDFEEIQQKLKLGVSSTSIKTRHCQGCPLSERCYYPRQYQDVMDPKHRVVIIQHAHFSTQEVIWELMKKKFDALFIDESFIGNIYSALPLNPVEISILKSFGYNWTDELGYWMKGNKARGFMNPQEDELREVWEAFEIVGLVWRIPEMIRLYNQKRLCNPYTGVEVIHELPNIPVRAMTDATPPEQLIKHLTGIKELQVFGRDEVIDYRLIHPENFILQVLDSSTSVTSLRKKDKWERIMLKIIELINFKFPDKKILLTVYKKDFKRVEEFFLQQDSGDLLSRVLIERMDKGTNAYSEFDVQFLLAGVYFTGNDYLKDTYKYKTVENYYREKEGLPDIGNVFPMTDRGLISIEQKQVPVSRIETNGDSGALVEYPGLLVNRPTDIWHQYCHDLNIGNTQQAIRLRFKPDKPRAVYVLTNMPLPSFLITDSILLQEFVRPLPNPSSKY